MPIEGVSRVQIGLEVRWKKRAKCYGNLYVLKALVKVVIFPEPVRAEILII